MYEVLHQLCLISLCRALLLLVRGDPTQQNILWEGGDYWDRGGEVYRMSSKIWIQAMLKLRFDGGEMPHPGASTGIRLGVSFRPQAVFHDLIVNVWRQLQSLHFKLMFLKTENDRL